MAKTLGFIADRFIAAGHATTVVAREQLSPNFVRLVVQSDDFRTATTVAGDATAWVVAKGDFRHYTPAVIDAAAGELVVIIQLHGSGLGEEMLLGLNPGDSLPMTKWAHKKSFMYQPGDEPIVVVGDGTVVSLAMAFAAQIGDTGRPYRAILEVAEEDVEATRALVPGAEVVAKGAATGDAANAYLASAEFTGEEIFFLAGHGQTIQQQRDLLRNDRGIDRKSIKTQPYWATGKVGL